MAYALAVLLVVVAGCSSDGSDEDAVLGPGEDMPKGMTVTSSAFDGGGQVPERFSCEGENVPPPLRWSGAPKAARELAVVIEDPDAPDGTFVHWLVVGIDPRTTAVGPGGPPPGATVLPGSSDNPTYIGPCPPDGDGPHRYFFEVYALPEAMSLSADADPLENVRALRKAATAGGALIATFER